MTERSPAPEPDATDSGFRPLQPPLEVVLVAPEIPPNTGNVARLCACTGSRLHLVAPLGFSLTDKDLRRAGLDYWSHVYARTWESFEEFESAHDLGGAGRGRLHLFAAKGQRKHIDASFHAGDILVFGRESRGLPASLIERYVDRTVRLPMMPGRRSLNLAASAAVGVYEALRQAGAFAA
jgi:tRNA (cytidine/uridine-2'-O-)-methyltransferase